MSSLPLPATTQPASGKRNRGPRPGRHHLRERGGPLAAAGDRCDAARGRQRRAAVDGGDGKVQLRTAALTRQRDANRVEQRAPFLPGALLDPICRGAERLAIEAGRVLQLFAERRNHLAGAGFVEHLGDVGPGDGRRCVELEQEAEAIRNLLEPIDGSDRHRQQRREEFHRLVRSAAQVAAGEEVARRLAAQPRRRGQLHVLAVHPRQLFRIEDARTVADVLDGKAARHLVDREQLLIAARRPAQKREVIRQRFGQEAPRPELGHRGRAMTLRERRVIRPHHHGEMGERRRREPERLIEKHLTWRVRDVILTPNHVRDLHHRIVHHDGEVVGGTAVGAHQHGVADHVRAERDLTADEILERDLDILRDPQADHRPLAGVGAALDVSGREIAAGPAILGRAARRKIRLTIRFELGR